MAKYIRIYVLQNFKAYFLSFTLLVDNILRPGALFLTGYKTTDKGKKMNVKDNSFRYMGLATYRSQNLTIHHEAQQQRLPYARSPNKTKPKLILADELECQVLA